MSANSAALDVRRLRAAVRGGRGETPAGSRRDADSAAATADSPDQIELRGFSRSIAEIEWLLLVLVLLYFVMPGARVDEPAALVGTAVGYACCVLAFRYARIAQSESRWKLAVETWLILMMLTAVLWQTGKADSALVNLFLLVIIVSGLTLGKLTTTLMLLLSATIYFYSAWTVAGDDVFALVTFADLMIKFAPFLLAAYLVTLLSADIALARGVLKDLSETDELTGAQNRRGFNAALHREATRASRYGRSFSLLLIDADGLKPTNDRHGHAAGDRLIRLIADSIADSLRACDEFARVGGDEFAVMLTETAAPEAATIAERIRMRIMHAAFDHDGKRVASTVSVGVASFRAEDANGDAVLARADAALYLGKRDGGNCVVVTPA